MTATPNRHRWPRRIAFAAVLVVLFVVGCVTGRGQPHMQAAIDQLQAAKSELEEARANKGGHRMRAIELIDQAIAEAQAGIDYAGGAR